MKVKIVANNLKDSTKSIETFVELNMSGKYKGYSLINTLDSKSKDVIMDMFDVTYEVLDGEFEGFHTYCNEYLEEDVEIL